MERPGKVNAKSSQLSGNPSAGNFSEVEDHRSQRQGKPSTPSPQFLKEKSKSLTLPFVLRSRPAVILGVIITAKSAASHPLPKGADAEAPGAPAPPAGRVRPRPPLGFRVTSLVRTAVCRRTNQPLRC